MFQNLTLYCDSSIRESATEVSTLSDWYWVLTWQNQQPVKKVDLKIESIKIFCILEKSGQKTENIQHLNADLSKTSADDPDSGKWV